ncbi:MAG: ferrochelatase [Vicinamibacterales bacterium]
MTPFDAVLMVSFGGPQGLADVRPFLENVLRGRRVAPGRIDEVAHHYELFGGVSPLTALTMKQADGLRERLAAGRAPLPVYVGMRNWHPFLADTLAEMSRAGVRRAVGLIAAAHRSYSSCTQYKENVAAARATLRERGLRDVEVTYVGDWYTHPRFIEANAARVREAIATLPPTLQDRAELVFTAHSIPVSMADQYPYQRQFEETSRLIAANVNAGRPLDGHLDHVAIYQSRSGRPEDPWLGPDVGEYLRGLADRGGAAAVLSPAGFLIDHVEVLYDLDVEATDIAREIGLTIARAGTVGDHPLFLDMLADVVMATVARYESGRPLQLVANV